jgi:hypothetical protein
MPNIVDDDPPVKTYFIGGIISHPDYRCGVNLFYVFLWKEFPSWVSLAQPSKLEGHSGIHPNVKLYQLTSMRQ